MNIPQDKPLLRDRRRRHRAVRTRKQDRASLGDELCTNNCQSSRSCDTDTTSCICLDPDNQRILFCLRTSCSDKAVTDFQDSLDEACKDRPTISTQAQVTTHSSRTRNPSLTASSQSVATGAITLTSSILMTFTAEDTFPTEEDRNWPTYNPNSRGLSRQDEKSSLPMRVMLTAPLQSNPTQAVTTSSTPSLISAESTSEALPGTTFGAEISATGGSIQQESSKIFKQVTTIGIVTGGIVIFISLALLVFWLYRQRKRVSDTASLRSSSSIFGDKKAILSSLAVGESRNGSSWIDFEHNGSILPDKERTFTIDKMEHIEPAVIPLHGKLTSTPKGGLSETSSFAKARAHIRKSQQSFLNLLSSRTRSDAGTLASESHDNVGTSRGIPYWIDMRHNPPLGQSDTTRHTHQRNGSVTPSSLFTPAPFLAASQSAAAPSPSRPSYIRSKSGKTSFLSRRLLDSDTDYQIKRKKPPRPTTAEVRTEQQDRHDEIVRRASTPHKAFVLDITDSCLSPKPFNVGYRGSASLYAGSEHSVGSYPQAPSEDGDWNAAPTRPSSIDLAWVTQPGIASQTQRVTSLRSQYMNETAGTRSPRRKAAQRKSGSSNRLKVPTNSAEAGQSPALPSSDGSSRPHSVGSPYTPPSAGTTRVGRAI